MSEGFQSNIKNRTANSVDPDESARDEPSHLDLYCLHRYLFFLPCCRAERVNGAFAVYLHNSWILQIVSMESKHSDEMLQMGIVN